MDLRAQEIGAPGDPLVIIHGVFGSGDNWRTLAKGFAQNGLWVHLLDLRNHGRSPHSWDMSLAQMAQDVMDYIESHQLDRVSLLGHSLGGKVVAACTQIDAQKINKLIIGDIAPTKSYTNSNEHVLAAISSLDFNILKDRRQVESQLRLYLDKEGEIQFLLKNIYWETPQRLAFRFNQASIVYHYKELTKGYLPKTPFMKPSLFINGADSNYLQEADRILINTYFPNAQYKTIPNAGHWLHADQPGLFFNEVISFIKK